MMEQATPRDTAQRPVQSPATLAAAFAAESAWALLVLRCLMVFGRSSVVFGPASVLLPFGVSALMPIGLSRWMKLGHRVATGLSGSTRPTQGMRLRSALAPIVDFCFLGSAAVAYLLLGVLTFLAAVRIELINTGDPFDSAWFESALEASRRSVDPIAPIGWLLVLSVILWIRGTMIGRRDVSLPPPLTRFAWGAAVLVVLVLSGMVEALDVLATTQLLGLFLMAGLVSVHSFRLDQSDRSGAGTGGWRLGTAGLSVGIIAATLGLSWLTATYLAGPVRELWDGLCAIVLPILTEIGIWLAHLLARSTGQFPPPPAEPHEAGEGFRDFMTLPDQVREAARWLFGLSWLAMILAAVFATLRRWLDGLRGPAETAGTRSEISWSLSALLWRVLSTIILLLGRRWPVLLGILKRSRQAERAGTVRDLYRRLLVWAGREGMPLMPWMTPIEHGAVLRQTWPSLCRDFDTLIDAYVTVRYGGATLSDAEFGACLAGWRAVVASTSGPNHTARRRRSR